MAYKNKSFFLALLVLFPIIAGQASAAGRQIPKNKDVKQPEFLFKSDPSFLIPGIGRYMFPCPGAARSPSYNPITGRPGYTPGGDDTFVPNPGVEVPSGGATIPAPIHP